MQPLTPSTTTMEMTPCDQVATPTLRHRESHAKDHSENDSTVISVENNDGEAPVAVLEKPKSEASAPRAKVLFLDGMRGAAALIVVCHHLGYLEGTDTGGVAVHTFFVLSAFLLTMLLEKKFETLYQQGASRKRWALALFDYAIRRVLRVYPLVMVIGIVLQFCSDKQRHQSYDFKDDKYSYNFLKLLIWADGHRFYVFWTLPLELTYYLMIPVFVGVTVCLRRWWWVPMLPLTGWVIYSGLYVFVTAGSPLWRHLPEFVAGSIGAVVYNRLSGWIQKTNFTFRPWHRIVIWIIEAIVVVLLVSVICNALLFDSHWLGRYPFRINESNHFVCVHVVVLIVLEMVSPGPVSSFFEWSLLRYAGKISFSVYLLHPPIIFSDFVVEQTRNYYTKYFTVWILLFFWGTVSYHAIEYPSQKLAGFFGKKIKAMDNAEREKEKGLSYAALQDA